jgi:hypothetical protein
MKAYFTILVILFAATFCFAQDYEWESVSFAKTSNNDIPLSKIAITADNHKIFTGRFEQSMEYKGVTLTSSLYYGAFIAKLDENDSLLWIRKFAESKHLSIGVTDILGMVTSLDLYDNYFYLNLYFSDSIYVDNQLFIANQNVPSYHKSLALKFDMNGTLIEDFILNGTCINNINNMLVDKENNLYIYGAYGNDEFSTTSSCSCIFGNQTLTTTKANIFLAKYDSLGSLIWINTFGENKFIGATGFTIIDDAIYITGGSLSASDIDFGPYTLTYPNNYDNGAFMAKYDTSGNFIWAKYYGVKGWDSHVSPNDLLALSNNKIIVTGAVRTQSESAHLYFQNSSPLTRNSSSLEFNYYVICYDSLGNILWKDLAQCDGQDYITSMTTNEDKVLFVTGQYSKEMHFGNDTLPFAYERLFVAAFDSIGNKLWAKDIGNGGGNSGIDIEIDSNDNIYVNGWATANPTIVGSTSYSINGPSVFIAKMAPTLVSSTTNIQAVNPNKKLLKIVDVLVRETKVAMGSLLFFIYSDGTVEKKVFVE